MRLTIVVALVCVATVAFAWDPVPGLEVKWQQLPDGANSLHSQFSEPQVTYFVQAADDFLCEDGREIIGVEWWGTYTFADPPPNAGYYFKIEFWTDNGVPTPDSHPLDLIYTEEIHVFYELWDEEFGQWHFLAELPEPFQQEAGNTYWISIYGVWDNLPSFNWCTGGPAWEDCANYRQGPPLYNNPPSGITDVWQGTFEIAYFNYEWYDMAFVLYGERELEDVLGRLDNKWQQLPDLDTSLHSQLSGPQVTYLVQAADDFLCVDGREIVAVEWWGTYMIGGPPPPAGHHFIIEFWTNTGATPDSHPLDLVYTAEIHDYTKQYDEVYLQDHYAAELPTAFQQQQGHTYWISIYAVWDNLPSFGWCTGYPPWEDCANYRGYNLYGATLDWQSTLDMPFFNEWYDMAFGLYVEPGVSPVEETSWGSIKAMFR